MDFGTLQNRLAFILNFNDGQTDQDFSAARLKQALNFAYNREIQRAVLEGSKRYWKRAVDISWPADQVTLPLPSTVKKKAIYRIQDVTDDSIGAALIFSDYGLTGDVFWKDHNTLQWGVSGPGSARTLRVFYVADTVDMVSDGDEPELMPEPFHEVILWSAACWLRTIADEAPPQAWLMQLNELRMDLWKYVSMGRPREDEPTITLRDSDLTEEL
jgi:hypothetical protein